MFFKEITVVFYHLHLNTVLFFIVILTSGVFFEKSIKHNIYYNSIVFILE